MNAVQRGIAGFVGQAIKSDVRRKVDDRDSKCLAAIDSRTSAYQARELVAKVRSEHPELFEGNPLDSIPMVNANHGEQSNTQCTSRTSKLISQRLSEVQRTNGSLTHFVKQGADEVAIGTANLFPGRRLGESEQDWQRRMILENTVRE
jgi:hypothetical protein